MPIANYLKSLEQKHGAGGATEHTHRPALQNLLEALLPRLTVSNEPARQACGAPDFILLRKGTPVAFVETKNIGDGDLAGRGRNKEQFDRYREALDNIAFTDYLDFHFCRKGRFAESIRIA